MEKLRSMAMESLKEAPQDIRKKLTANTVTKKIAADLFECELARMGAIRAFDSLCVENSEEAIDYLLDKLTDNMRKISVDVYDEKISPLEAFSRVTTDIGEITEDMPDIVFVGEERV